MGRSPSWLLSRRRPGWWWLFIELLLCLASGKASAQLSLVSRLEALNQAVDAHLQATQDSRPAPTEWRKVLWFGLMGDKVPDALVILRSRRDECAVVADGPQACRALVLMGLAGGGYRVATEFKLRVHAVGLLRSPDGVRDLLYSRDAGPKPVYGRYRFDGQVFNRMDEDVTAEQLLKWPVLLADDRSMSLLQDQLYTARQFPNDGARLAPFRLHYDAMATSGRRQGGLDLIYDKDFDQRVQQQVESLTADARLWSRSLAWPHTLELRVWSCIDWMVERRFWEIEDRRLGRIGACIEPSIVAIQYKLSKTPEAATDLTRALMLQQVGVAWALRVSSLPAGTLQQLRLGGSAQTTQYVGALAGHWLAHQLRQPGLERMTAALVALGQVAEKWYEVVELGEHHYVSPTPELRAFAKGLNEAIQAHQCVRRVAGLPQAKAFPKVSCEGKRLEEARQILALLQEDLKP